MKLLFPRQRSRRAVRRWLWVPLAMLAAGFAVCGASQDLPEGLSSQAGGVTASTSGNTMTITQAQQRGIAHWDSFNISTGNTVNVQQPSASSVLLNRVMGTNPDNVSIISGALNANGHVYLINPAGIVFGSGAQVNVGGIVASTLDLQGSTLAERNANFLAGRDRVFVRDGVQPAEVWVDEDASIAAAPQGRVMLMSGGRVTNYGRIEAEGGQVGLGVGTRIELDPFGDGLTTLRIDTEEANGAWVENYGQILADGGRVELRANDSEGGVGNIWTDSLPSAGRIVARDGQIILDAGGGRVDLDGELDARGTASGGYIETSGSMFAIGSEFAVDASASAPNGQAGTWLLDPQDVYIVAGPPAGDLNTLYDSTISAALDTGTNVTVVTPPGGSATEGNVFFDDAVIQRSTAGAPVSFTVNADRSILSAGNVTIQSIAGAGPLHVHLNADAHNHPGDPVSGGGRIDLASLAINTNGGDIVMNANWSGPDVPWAIQLDSSQLNSGSGSITLTGFSADSGGVLLADTQLDASGPGAVAITGVGQNPQVDGGPGVQLSGASIDTQDGNISVHGHVQDQSAAAPQAGVHVDGDSWIVSATGDLDLVGSAGSTEAGSAGIRIGGRVEATGGHVSLRASNDGNADALVIDPGSPGVRAGGMLNLRPGEVSTGGVAADRLGDAITLGTDGNGFSVSVDELSRLSAGDAIVLGSAVHAGVITVDDSISLAGSLTLQNEGAGSGGISLQASAAVSGTLGLLSAGDVVQAAPVAASQVLARSSGGDVLLDNPGNDATTVSGGAASGRFTWVDANAVALAPVAATGAQVAINVPQAINPGTLSAGSLLVQTLSDDLTLSMPLTSSAGADLVAAGLFQNPGAGSAGGAPWRVWASTWAGESRGGMSGSGALPNLYNCPYGGPCGVSIPSGDNHFIYAAQPTATVDIDDVSRALGWPNPPLTYGISGLILGDGGAAVTGSIATTAGLLSAMGNYPITGSFTSQAGYAVTVNPGILRITEFVQPPVGQVPTLGLPGNSAIYEENLGGAPICLASEPLAGDGQLADGDMLAREWSRVRTRPQLTNCLRSSRREACSDF